MIELSAEERTLLARLEKPGAFVYRQAEEFSLIYEGFYVCKLDTKVCRDLIEKACLVEVGQKEPENEEDDTMWLYGADPRLFAPQFQVETDNDRGPIPLTD